jgi:mono/diheme cytochrome c family protein
MLPALTGVARSQEPGGDPQAGHTLVKTWCTNCHVVEPLHPAVSTDVAPSFSAVAHMPSTTSMSIHVFLQTSHGQMPDFKLSREQIDDIAAYILTLREQ